MAKKILFVVEGERMETRMLASAFKRVLLLSDSNVEICKYKTNIHKLYKKMKKDNYDSFLSFLYSYKKDVFPKEMITPETAFSSVYLFFDLDPQDELFSIDETKEIASFFDDESINGKLYINYPMVESIFDFTSYNFSHFSKRKYPIKNLSKKYKTDARFKSFLAMKYKTTSFRKIRDDDIYSICILNMKKYSFINKEKFDRTWKNQYSPIKSLLSEIPFIKTGYVSILNCGILLIPDYSIFLLENAKKLSK